jgi:uncharacterized RDD family membrane protein YckC
VSFAADRVHRRARRADAEAGVADTLADPVDVPYAGFVTRTIAFAADAALINLVAILVGAVVALLFSVLPESKELRSVTVAIGAAAFVAWDIGYFVTFWTTTGETPGSRLMRIRVVRADGTKLRVRHALLRLAGLILGLPLFVGYLPILLTDRRRGLQDAMGGTVVVSGPERFEQGSP